MKTSLVVDLPPQVEARVQAEATKQHTTPAALIADLVSRALPEDMEAQQPERSLTLLRSVAEIGDEEEQRETFTYLKQAVEEDQLSERKRFG